MGLMINVQLEDDGPITQMDEALLIRREGGHDDENERVNYVEYRLRSDPKNPRAVHRSVDMYLKTPMVFAEGEVAKF